jgi:hypothetical protein
MEEIMPVKQVSGSNNQHQKALQNKAELKKNVSDTLLPEVQIISDMPSGGIGYPEGYVIKYRPYTWGEIKKVSQSKIDSAESLNFVLKGIETSFPIEDLTFNDFLYVAFLRKVSTFGESKFSAEVKCDECGNIFSVPFTTSHLEFNELKAPELPVVAPLGKHEMEFYPITIGGFQSLLRKNLGEDPIAILASSCADMEFDEVYSILENLPPFELEIIKDIDYYLNHGLKPLELKCSDPACGAPIELRLDSGEQLIKPFRGDSDDVKRRVRFGSKTKDKSN